MKALLKFILSLRGGKTAAREETQETAANLTFERLSWIEQDIVRRYFYAAADVMKTCNSIRHQHRAMDVDEILQAFCVAEQNYVKAGFKPFFPPSIQVMHEFNSRELVQANLLHRLTAADQTRVFSPTMNQFVRRLIRSCRASVLHTSDFDHLMNPTS